VFTQEFRCRWSQDLEQSPVFSALSRLVHWTVQMDTEDVYVCLRPRRDCDFFCLRRAGYKFSDIHTYIHTYIQTYSVFTQYICTIPQTTHSAKYPYRSCTVHLRLISFTRFVRVNQHYRNAPLQRRATSVQL